MKANGNDPNAVTNDITQMERRIGLLRQVAGRAALDVEIAQALITQTNKDVEALEKDLKERIKELELAHQASIVKAHRRSLLILLVMSISVALNILNVILWTMRAAGVL